MIKKMIPEFGVKNSQEAIEFYKKVLKVKVMKMVIGNSSGVPASLHRIDSKNNKAIADSLLKLGNDYFKIYEWNDKFDGPYDEKIIKSFNFHLQFSLEKDAQDLWNNFLKYEKTSEIIKFHKTNVGDFWFMFGIIQDPYHIKWTFTYYPDSNEIH